MTDYIEVGLRREGLEAERAILVGSLKQRDDGQHSLREMADLARAAGVIPVGLVTQHRDAPHQNTFVGKGKLEELKLTMAELDATVVLFDGDLTPRQVRTLVDRLEGKILDRTELILDIFAQHARTAEGKLQVELAQLSYLLPRLTGRGKMMDRIGGGGGSVGGVGVRGPGETKLETDRRRLRMRVSRLRDELKEVRKRRDLERDNRRRGGLHTVAIVGYTNAGKSTLLNALAGSEEVSAHDRLFETLDPTTRKVRLGDGEVLLSDTVGFIKNLPKALVAAFRATLEEVVESDLIVHVVEACSDFPITERTSTEETLAALGVDAKPTIVVLNKWDIATPEQQHQVLEDMPDGLPLSALTGYGLDELREDIAERAFRKHVPLTVVLPYNRLELLNLAHAHGRVLAEQYETDGLHAELEVEEAVLDRFREFVTSE
jgi:GTPase